MLDPHIAKFAKENNLKTNGQAAFGLYKNQLVAIGSDSNGIYHLRFTQKTQLKNHEQNLKKSENLRRLKLHRRFNIEKDLTISWIIPTILRKNKGEKLQAAMDAATEALNQYQSFDDHGEVVLHNNIARFESEVSSPTVESKQLQPEPDHLMGVIGAVIATIISGLILGYIQYLLGTEAKAGLNPLFVGFLTGTIATLTYRKLSGQIDLLCRILLIPLSGVGHLISLSATTYFYLQGKGFDVSIAMITDQVSWALSERTLYHSLSVVYGVILAFNAKTKRNEPNPIEYGDFITDETYENLEAHKKGDKVSIFLFAFALIYFFGSLIFASSSNQFLSRVSSFYTFLYMAATLHITLVALGYYLAKRYKVLELTLTHFGMTRLGPKGKFGILNLIIIFFTAGNFFLLIVANSKFDRSLAEKHSTNITNGKYSGVGEKRNYCADIKHWRKDEPFSGFKICHDKYPGLRTNEAVDISVKSGFFGVPWVSQVELPRFSNLKTFLTSLEKPSDLRHKTALIFFQRAKEKDTDNGFLKPKIQEWTNQCEKSRDYSCRLRSYYADFEKDLANNLRYLELGCDGEDVVACYGLYLNENSSEQQKQKYFSILEKKCDEKTWKHCLELGKELWRSDYEGNYASLIKIYDRTCNEGKSETACEGLKRLKTYPVKR